MIEPSSGRRFHLKARLGAGAFGEVFLADMESGGGFRRRVALKVLHSGLDRVPDAGRRMRDEARVLGRLAHRNIVAVIDLVQLEDRWAVVLDHVPGADVQHVIATCAETDGRGLPGPAALDVATGMLCALDAALHTVDDDGTALQVVHRDIKPANVRITPDGDVRVLDFGVARFTLDSRETDTKATGWIGTELYMSPERIVNEGDTPAGDVYAVGATLVEMLTGAPLGRTPVLPDKHAAMVDAALDRARKGLRGPAEAVDELVGVLRSMLAVEPDDRLVAAAAVEALEGLAGRLEGERLPAFARRIVPQASARSGATEATTQGTLFERPSGPVPETMAWSAAPSAARSSPPPAPSAPIAPRSPWVLAGGVAAALVLGIGGLVSVILAGLLYVGIVEIPGQRPEGAATRVVPAAPAVTPVPVPAPAPAQEVGEAAPAAPPGSPGAATSPSPSPVPPPSPKASSAPPGAAEVPGSGPRVEKAQIAVRDVTGFTVTCGDRRFEGTASARITDFPAGTCVIEAEYLGRTLRAEVPVERPRTVRCTVTGEGVLSCS